MKTDYEIKNERAIAGGGRAGWEARERIKRERQKFYKDELDAIENTKRIDKNG
jgi:hypothetical protein